MNPTVKLISYTPDALELLLYTKNVRLKAKGGIEEIKSWPMEKKMEHLAYMKGTIKSSWEFVDFVFEVKGVDRIFTHQYVRTRTGSYAQQAQRAVDVRDAGYRVEVDHPVYHKAAKSAFDFYQTLVDAGVEIQKARAILPGCTLTEIIAKFNLRTLHEMAKVRLCKRSQGQYQEVFKMMKKEVVKVYPWAEDFIHAACVQDGICAFPRYSGCPIQKHTIKPTAAELFAIKQHWENTTHEASPVAKNGVTM